MRMNLKKRLLKLLSVTMLVSVVLAGCATKQAATNGNTAGPASTADTASAGAKTGNFAMDYVSKKKDGFVIGVSNGWYGNSWKTQLIEGFEKVANEYKKEGSIKDLIIQNTNEGPQGQIAAIEGLINSGVDAIIIDPASSNSLAPVISKAVAKGILVVFADQTDKTPNTISVTGNAGLWAEIQSVWLAEQLKGKGEILKITGVAGSSSDDIRQAVEKKVFAKYPDIKILASAPGDWDPTKAQQVMSTFLSSYKKFDGLYAYEVMQPGILQAFKAANRELPVMTGDYTMGFLRTWKKEYPNLNSIVTTAQPGVGGTALKITLRLLQGKKLKPESITANEIAPEMINNVAVPPAFVITKEAQPNAPWMKNTNSFTKAISLDEALALGEGLPDSTNIDSIWTDEQVDALFVKK